MAPFVSGNYFVRVLSAIDRVANAVWGGKEWMTFSAGSWDLALTGSKVGKWRVKIVDSVVGNGHCEKYWNYHMNLPGSYGT